MDSLGSRLEVCEAMGNNSRQHIAHYSPVEWSLGIVRALGSMGGAHA
jgi:hypothetical protein